MLDKTQMQEIQDLKLRGYTKSEIRTYYEQQGRKPPSRPTISKYYDMDVVPEDPGAKLSKDKAFDISPFKETIISILEDNSRKDFCISSVYDVLEEKFIENGDLETLPGNEQTLRNYVHYLEESGQINTSEEHRRVYDHVCDDPYKEPCRNDLTSVRICDKGRVSCPVNFYLFSRFPADMHGCIPFLLILLDVIAELGIHERLVAGLAAFYQVFCPEEFFVDSVTEQFLLDVIKVRHLLS